MSLSSSSGLFTLKLALVRVGPKGGKSLQGDVQNYCFSLVLQQVLRFQEVSTVLLSHQQPVFSQLYCCCGTDFIVSLLELLQAELSPPTSLFLNRPLQAVGEWLTFWKHFHWFSLSWHDLPCGLQACLYVRVYVSPFSVAWHITGAFIFFFHYYNLFPVLGPLLRSSSLFLSIPCFFVQADSQILSQSHVLCSLPRLFSLGSCLKFSADLPSYPPQDSM